LHRRRKNRLSESCIESLESRQLLAFSHPGITNTQADFDRIAEKVAAGAQPWAGGWNLLTSDGYSQLGASPRPLQTVIRGGDGQNFNQMVIDIQRTYELALRWKISGDTRFADLAVTFLNSWSSTMTTLTGNADRFLASGLYGYDWAAAAEIMRGYSGWASADLTKFQNYLVGIYYPMQHDFLVNHNGAAITNYWANWDLANVEGMLAVGIFADRQDLYDEAMNYLFTGKGNGALDKAAYYRHPGNLMQWQESGRDQGHTILGMALFGHIAQLAWNQGNDLFSYNNYQFLASAEYVAKYNLGYDVPFETYNWGTGQSGAFQSQTVVSNASRGNGGTGYALILGHYAQMLGMAAPYSAQRVTALGVEGRNNGDEFGFGTLTYSFDPMSAPQAPRGLTAAEKEQGNVELDWFGGAGAATYNVYRATSANGTYAQIASGITDLLTYTDRNLAQGTYYYKVSSVSASGETEFSNIVSATSTTQLHTQLNFDEAGDNTVADASGNGGTGALNGGASFVAGKTGNAISLNGSSGYVSLPDGIVSDVDDFTIAAWMNLNSAATWSRIFDFGDDRGRWMYLTPRNGGGVVEFATGTVYGYNKQWVVGTSALPTNQWVHVAVTLSDHVGKLYVNGALVGANANMDFPPAQIGATTQNWIGRSQFAADPFLSGKIDDFRIYRGAMKPGEVYTLATGLAAPTAPVAPASLTAMAIVGNRINLSWPSVANATNYSLKRSTTVGGAYTTIAAGLKNTTFADTSRIAGTTYYYIVTALNSGGESASSPQASAIALPPMPGAPSGLVAKPISSSAISLTWAASSDAASYNVRRSTVSGGPYTTIASNLTTTSFTDTGRAVGTRYYYVVTATNASGTSAASNEASATPSDLLVRLKLDETTGATASDSSGNNSAATLVNGPVWTTGKLNGGVDLDGTDDYLSLPTGVVSGLTNCTIATWVYLDALSNWSRIFDFGTGATVNMFLTPANGANGRVRFAITTGGNGAEKQITGPSALPTGAWTHVAVTLDSTGLGILYINGVEVGRNSSMLTPAALGTTTQNYLGKSQYNDPYLKGRLDDFRIYTRALDAGEISSLSQATLPAAPTGLSATVGDAQVQLSWSAVASATGYIVKRADTSGGPYFIVAADLTTTNWIDTTVANDTTYYYIVSATNLAGEGAISSEASATPDHIDPALPGDANNSGRVDSTDFTALASHFNKSAMTWSEGDFNGDGLVNALDFNLLAENFGASSSAAAIERFSTLAVSFASPDLFSQRSLQPPQEALLA
jgi:fibronectin type 3 domain-containing protein